MSAETIDEVIEQLTNIMDRAYRERSRLGFICCALSAGDDTGATWDCG